MEVLYFLNHGLNMLLEYAHKIMAQNGKPFYYFKVKTKNNPWPPGKNSKVKFNNYNREETLPKLIVVFDDYAFSKIGRQTGESLKQN